MGKKTLKQKNKVRRILRIRSSVRSGQIENALLLYCSNRYMLAQVLRVSDGKVLFSAGSNEKDFSPKGKNKETAQVLGRRIAERSIQNGVSRVFFDRRGKKYHGKVAVFCDSARESGLKF